MSCFHLERREDKKGRRGCFLIGYKCSPARRLRDLWAGKTRRFPPAFSPPELFQYRQQARL